MNRRPLPAPFVLTFAALLIFAKAGWSDELQPAIPDSEKKLVTQAKALRLQEHDDAAEKILEDVIARHGDYYKAHYNLGLVYQDQGDYDRAVAELDKARSIRESQNLAEYSIYNTLGWCYMLKGDTKSAEKYYTVALQHESENSRDTNIRLYNNLSWMYYHMGNVDEARKYANIASEKYNSGSGSDMVRLIDQLEVDQKQIKAKAQSFSSPSADAAHP